MMNEHDLNRLREAVWRGEIPPGEAIRRAQAERAPEEIVEALRLEARLSQSLRTLPDVPVASNFTARVLQTIEAQGYRGKRAAARQIPWWRLWLPRLAGAGAVAMVVYAGIWQSEQKQARQQVAQSLQQVAGLVSAPGLADSANAEIWQDFDVILRMGAVTADEELLSVARAQ
jgi:hypothetical protein